MKKIATAFDDPAMIRAIRDKQGHIVAFGRTRLGQIAYDVFISSMSAAEAARRHKVKREFVLQMRHENPGLRPKNRKKASQ